MLQTHRIACAECACTATCRYDGSYVLLEGHKDRVLNLGAANYLNMGGAASSKVIHRTIMNHES